MAETNYREALATLNSMYHQFELTEEQENELAGLQEYIHFLQQIENEETNIYELSETKLAYLENYIQTHTGRGVVFANNILCELYGICIEATEAEPQSNKATEVEYVSIPDNHVWSVNFIKFGTCGDTIINGKNYLKVYWKWKSDPFDFDCHSTDYCCALRNDTLNKKVYVVYPPRQVYEISPIGEITFLFNATDTTEFLLYDFLLNIGDTVSIYEISGFIEKIIKVNMIRVEEVMLQNFLTHTNITYSNSDSIQMLENGDMRRRILMRMNCPDWLLYRDGSTVWTEGIGSIHGLTKQFYDDLLIADRGFWNLRCYAHENELLLSTPWNVDNNCFGSGGGGNVKENIKNIITIYPNPATDFIIIKDTENMLLDNCWVEVFDVYGQSVLKQLYEDKIDVSALKSGFYILKITTSKINNNVGRFVKF